MRGQAILSIHDVFPATFSQVEKIISLLEECGVPPATLLVVPGREWSEERLADLRRMAEKGHPLAGHGWVHKAVPTSRTLFHKFHAALISRDEAEHLSRPPDELREMIERCYEWFPSVGLPAPELYVPPAWALGSLDLGKLKDLPFRWYEILRGFVEGETGQTRWLPLAGFEADTTFRQVSLRLWNGHVLFILGIFLLLPRWKPLVAQSLIFTLAHSLTLGLAALGWLQLPEYWVELAIAASIAWIVAYFDLTPKGLTIALGKLDR